MPRSASTRSTRAGAVPDGARPLSRSRRRCCGLGVGVGVSVVSCGSLCAAWRMRSIAAFSPRAYSAVPCSANMSHICCSSDFNFWSFSVSAMTKSRNESRACSTTTSKELAQETNDELAARSGDKRRKQDKLSLHPLDLETALRAAMQTGTPPDQARRSGRKNRKT